MGRKSSNNLTDALSCPDEVSELLLQEASPNDLEQLVRLPRLKSLAIPVLFVESFPETGQVLGGSS